MSSRSQRGRRLAVGHEFVRVFVAQLVRGRTCSARAMRSVSSSSARGWIAASALARAQVALAVAGTGARRPRRACSAWRMAVIVSCSARRRAHVHVHVAGGDQRHAAALRRALQRAQARGVVRRRGAVRTASHARPPKQRAQPRGLVARLGVAIRQPQRQRAAAGRFEVVARQPVRRPCRRAGAPRVISSAQRVVALLRLDEQHQLRAVVERELAADDQLQPGPSPPRARARCRPASIRR